MESPRTARGKQKSSKKFENLRKLQNAKQQLTEEDPVDVINGFFQTWTSPGWRVEVVEW